METRASEKSTFGEQEEEILKEEERESGPRNTRKRVLKYHRNHRVSFSPKEELNVMEITLVSIDR